jgi:ATP-dependent DNA helicase RecG
LEHQGIEWKSSWRDEYLKWICGYANAQGGILEIGKDNDGVVIGLSNVRKLLDDIPNKIKNSMGIIADVNLLETNSKHYIAISVLPYSYPISFHGHFFYRSGSTMQELTGAALDEFLLRKQGKTWDGVPLPDVTSDDLDPVAFKTFRDKALKSERLAKEDLDITDKQLLKRLHLYEGKYLKRAAVLLFHPDPEEFVVGSYVKIGYFESDANLLYQDEVRGPLITLPDKVMGLLYTKYFKGMIYYEGIQRVDRYPVARDSILEAILNATIHKDYSRFNPIQIKVYSNTVIIYNNGALPEDWTVETLLATHGSEARNPNIASVVFKTGMVETWGSGIDKIRDGCRTSGRPDPLFEATKTGISVTFNTVARDGVSDGKKDGISDMQYQILSEMKNNPLITVATVAENVGINRRNTEKNIKQLKNMGLLRREGSNRIGKWIIVDKR